MGFLDKLKSVKNTLTGGGAEVYLSANASEEFFGYEYEITVKVGDADLRAEDVYVITKGVEEVEVLEADIVYDRQGEVDFRPDLVRASHTSFELRNVIELEEKVLSANETYAWQIEVELPENAQYPFRGRFCQFSHLAQAGVSCFGNDPDSGWIEIG